MIWFDVDAALSEVPINLMPLLDDTDFKSKEESVAYNAAGLDLVWNFITTAGAFTQTAVTPTDTGGNYDWVNQGNGHYSIEIPASGGASINNDTEGFGWFTGVATGVLPWRSPEFGFRAAGLNNLLIDSAHSATRGLAGTALPDAAADAAGGLPISDAGALDLDAQIGTKINDILTDTGTTLDTLVKDIPTVAEFEARTLVAASYFDPAADAVATVTNLTNLPAVTTDWLTAAGVKADAVTKIQSGLALEATLTAIKGAGWTDETLAKIVTDIAAISAGSGATAQEVWEYATRVLTAGTNIDLSALATTAHLQEVEDKVDTIDTNVDAVLADTGTDGVKVASLATDSITAAALKADAVTEIQNGLATAAALTVTGNTVNTIDGNVETILNDLVNGGRLDLLVDAIKAKTDNLPTDPADDSDIDTAIAAVKTVVDAIKTETDGHPTAAEVWSYGTRTLTNSTTGAVTPAEGDTLEVTKDATIIINFTGLGDISAYSANTSGQEDKVWFTAKENLDDPDSSAVIQIHTLYPAGTTPPDTLDYINGVAATATEGTFQFTDLVAGNATLTLAAAAAADLPVYAVSPLYWDIKILDWDAGTVSVLASGEMYIYGTPTKSIA